MSLTIISISHARFIILWLFASRNLSTHRHVSSVLTSLRDILSLYTILYYFRTRSRRREEVSLTVFTALFITFPIKLLQREFLLISHVFAKL